MERGFFPATGRESHIQGAGFGGFYFSVDAEEHATRFEQANKEYGIFVYHVTPSKRYSLDESQDLIRSRSPSSHNSIVQTMDGGKRYTEFVWNSDEPIGKGEYYTYDSFKTKFIPYSLVPMESLSLRRYEPSSDELAARAYLREETLRGFNFGGIEGQLEVRSDEIRVEIFKPLSVALYHSIPDIYHGDLLDELLGERLHKVGRTHEMDEFGRHKGTYKERTRLAFGVGHDIVRYLGLLIRTYDNEKSLQIYALWYCNIGCTLPSSRDNYERLVTRTVCEYLAKDKRISGRINFTLVEFSSEFI
jgi:hypothetical protein